MNKKSMGIFVLLIILVGSLVYFMVDKNNKNQVEEKIIKKEKNTQVEDKNQEIEVGKVAPNFKLTSIEGEEISLKDYKGKIVLINFWATWCKYCDQEMPDLQRFDKENEELVVLAVDVKEDKKLVEKYIKEKGLELPVLLDLDGEIAKTYRVSAFPTSYFVDEDGILLGGIPGMMTYDQMNEILEKIKNISE